MAIKRKHIYIDSAGDVTTDYTFTLDQACEDEIILADLYVIGEEDMTARVSNSTTGEVKGEVITIPLDFTDVETGSYGLKIWTEETGVLTKTIVIVK